MTIQGKKSLAFFSLVQALCSGNPLLNNCTSELILILQEGRKKRKRFERRSN